MVAPNPQEIGKGSYPQLGRIAAAYGVPHTGDPQIQLLVGGFSYLVSVELDSGTVTGLSLTVGRAGLPEITLRRENDSDRRGKELGLNVEAQVGDAFFDHEVYIETDVPESTVRTLFAAPEARRAVRDLLTWCRAVEITPLGITLNAYGRSTLFDPDEFQHFFRAAQTLAALPALPASAIDEPPRRGLGLVTLAAIFTPLQLAGAIFIGSAYTPERPLLGVIGAAVGLAAWALFASIARRLVRGHARSYRYYGILLGLTLVALPAFGFSVAVGVNALADSSQEQELVGRIVSARQYVDDGESRTEAIVEWTDGSRTTHDFDDEHHALRVGDRVDVARRAGFFGVPWISRDIAAHSPTAR